MYLFIALPRTRDFVAAWLATRSFSGDGAVAGRQAELTLVAALREESSPAVNAGVHARCIAGAAVETAGRSRAEDAAAFLTTIWSDTINVARRDASAGRSRCPPRALERVRQAGQGFRGRRTDGV